MSRTSREIPFGSGRRMIRTPHRAIRGDVALYTVRLQVRPRRRWSESPRLMSGVAYGTPYRSAIAGYRAQIQLIVGRGYVLGGVHQNKILFAQNFDCMVNLGVGAHSG